MYNHNVHDTNVAKEIIIDNREGGQTDVFSRKSTTPVQLGQLCQWQGYCDMTGKGTNNKI